MNKTIPVGSENGNFRALSKTDNYHHYNYNYHKKYLYVFLICFHTNYQNSVLNYSRVAPNSEVRTAVILVLFLA